ncbi:hypothetical protein K491DRAFT_723766 [Lophiostoma macrostomum CBS 122681]|uniref:Uncharacterized protein n=1 Tax=Lophiostoma macrostomum CBS 122681 TaxID=1314788 RepID=A0A6A6SGN5_9PLEO|nr:hypothetical protein K491DRAFT_723766 [Lophiostoma macrostomum CBS 122681]
MAGSSQRQRAPSKRVLSEERTQQEVDEQRKRPRVTPRRRPRAPSVTIFEDTPGAGSPAAGNDDPQGNEEDAPDSVTESEEEEEEDLGEFIAVFEAALNKDRVHVETMDACLDDFNEYKLWDFIDEARQRVL